LIEDFDSDGLRDIYVANGYKRDYDNRDVINSVFVEENQGKFSIDELNAQIPSFTPNNYFFKNKGGYQFSNSSNLISNSGPTNSQAVAMADFDNDGDLDLIVNNIDQEASLLENKSAGNNFLNIRLKSNVPGGYLNAKVKITTNNGEQYHEVKNARGYIARSTELVHFGLGQQSKIEEVEVTWLNGKVSRVANPTANKTLVVSQKEATISAVATAAEKMVIQETNILVPKHISREEPFNDYFKQVLLPQKYSQLGPFLSKGDLNGDGKEDFYIGGPKGQAGATYIRKGDQFILKKQPAISKDKAHEDMGSTFIDTDNDGDLDLYVVSGGNEYPAKSSYYADRLYLNDGKGNFNRTEGNIPPIPTSGSCVVAGDIDGDGDDDLFVGGRLFPNNYPLPTPSLLLRNDGGKFTDIAYTQGKGLNMTGLVTDAVFVDVDADNDQDLVVVGEWTGIIIYTNNNGVFEKQPIHDELLNTTKGWWKNIEAADLDGDGDKDLIVGNKGLNHKYTASKKKPLYVYADDFDGSGTYDVFLAKPLENRVVPIRGKECTSEQMPVIKEKFPTFEEFADANLDEIINVNTAPNLTKLEVNEFASLILENEGGKFSKIPLPAEVQFSEANSINIYDINKDGNQDIIIVGNNFDTEVETCRSDASKGTVLINNGNMEFRPLPDSKSEVIIGGNIKDAQLIENCLIVSETARKLKTYKILE